MSQKSQEEMSQKSQEELSQKSNQKLQPPVVRIQWRWAWREDCVAAGEMAFGYLAWKVLSRYVPHLPAPVPADPVFDTKKRVCAGAAYNRKTLMSRRRHRRRR